MALEVELKFLDADHALIRDRLAEASARRISGYFERNTVLDDPGRTLFKRSALLRLRQASRITMTVKRIPSLIPDSGKTKVYEEYQTEIADFDEMLSCLRVLGYSPVFHYEKYREKWDFLNCTVCLDTLPFGDFVEIEGSEDSILNCAFRLGLAMEYSSKKTYHELNRDYRTLSGLEPDENFVFTREQRSRLRIGI